MGLTEKLHKWLFTALGETTGVLVVVGFIAGIIPRLFIILIRFILIRIGIENMQNIKKSWEWIGKKSIMSMDRMKSDRIGFYIISNGKPYLDQEEYSDIKLQWTLSEMKHHISEINPSEIFVEQNYKIVSYDIVKSANKGINHLPEKLDIVKFKYLIYQVADQIKSYELYFTPDLPESNNFREILLDYGIQAYIILKIESEDRKKLYGFVIYTYSDIKLIPVNFQKRKYEHLMDVKTLIKNEYESILNNTFGNVIKKHLSSIKNKLLLFKKSKKSKSLVESNDYFVFKDFDYKNADLIKNEIFDKIQRSAKPINIIMIDNIILDSSGIASLLSCGKLHFEKFQEKLRINNLSQLQIKIFDSAKLYEILDYNKDKKYVE